MDGSTGFAIVTTFFGGSFVGSMVTLYFNNRKAKRELALDLVKQYIGKYDDVANVRHLLCNAPQQLANPKSLNEVIALANWMEFVSSCFLEGLADAALLRSMHLPTILAVVHRELTQCRIPQPAGEPLAAFDAARLRDWPNWGRVTRGDVPAFWVDSGVPRPAARKASEA
jgi:hypothetical protein